MINWVFDGMKEALSEDEIEVVNELIENHGRKIEYFFEEPTIKLFFKTSSLEGSKKRFNLRLSFETDVLKLYEEKEDWDLKKVVHKSFEGLINQIEHKTRR